MNKYKKITYSIFGCLTAIIICLCVVTSIGTDANSEAASDTFIETKPIGTSEFMPLNEVAQSNKTLSLPAEASSVVDKKNEVLVPEEEYIFLGDPETDNQASLCAGNVHNENLYYKIIGSTLHISGRQDHDGVIYDSLDQAEGQTPPWFGNLKIISAVIDDAIAPAVTKSWFSTAQGPGKTHGIIHITSLQGLSNISTSNLVDTSYMFSGLDYKYKVTSIGKWGTSGLDLSHVRNMNGMFSFSNPSLIFDGNITTSSELTSSSCVFQDDYGFNSIDLSTWVMTNVSTTSFMFYNSSISSISNIPAINLEALTNMNAMFGATGVTELDLQKVTGDAVPINSIYANMFKDCELLETVYASQDWNLANADFTNDIFTNCKKIMGGYGTKFDSTVDKPRAFVDREGQVGYFSFKGEATKSLIVTYDCGSGSWPKDANYYSQYIQIGSSFRVQGALTNVMTTPVKAGETYYFDFWQGSDGNTYNKGDVVNTTGMQHGTLTLTAVYRTPKVTVEAVGNGAVGEYKKVSDDLQTPGLGASLSTSRLGIQSSLIATTSSNAQTILNTYSKQDVSGQFLGWYTDKACTQALGTLVVKQDITIYVKYTSDISENALYKYTLDQLEVAAQDLENYKTNSKYYDEFVGYVNNGTTSDGSDNAAGYRQPGEKNLNNHWMCDTNGLSYTENGFITTNPFEFRVIDINHDKNINDHEVGLTLMATHTTAHGKAYNFNLADRHDAGWGNSDVRTTMENGDVVPAKIVEKAVSVQKDYGTSDTGEIKSKDSEGKEKTRTVTPYPVETDLDKIWNISLSELTGGKGTSGDDYPYSSEGNQYDAFKNKVSTASFNCIKGLSKVNTSDHSTYHAGTRSLGTRSTTNDVYTLLYYGENGPGSYEAVSFFGPNFEARGVCPCFCLGNPQKDLRDYSLNELQKVSYDLAVNKNASDYATAFNNFVKFGLTYDGHDNATLMIEKCHWAIDTNGKTYRESGFNSSNFDELRIIGINQETTTDGHSALTMMSTHSVGADCKFNNTETNTGWGDSYVRSQLNNYLQTSPLYKNNAVSECVKKYGIKSNDRTLKPVNDKIWIIGYSEMSGSAMGSVSYGAEGPFYQAFLSHDGRPRKFVSTENDRVTNHQGESLGSTTDTRSIWTRSIFGYPTDRPAYFNYLICFYSNTGRWAVSSQTSTNRAMVYCVCIKGVQ